MSAGSETDSLANRLADEFRREMAADFPNATLAEIDKRNAAETDPGVCHSHDFCDANMVMDSAFTKIVGHELDPDGESEADHDIWSRAWAIAVKAGFAQKIEGDA
jgi:hypothetical protein